MEIGYQDDEDIMLCPAFSGVQFYGSSVASQPALLSKYRRMLLNPVTILRFSLDRIAKLRFKRRFGYLPAKQFGELWFWDGRIQREYINWYRGKIAHLDGVPAPIDGTKIKIRDFDLKENAIHTWVNANIDRYPNRLRVPGDYFSGKRILDIGCGPNPYVLGLTNCRVFGLDQLLSEYRKLGFPLDKFSDRLTYVAGCAERMPFEDNCFDAVVSVNAIDHVDDLLATAKEVTRILRPEGILRMETHYHQAKNIEEPWVLNDDVIIKYFGHLGMRKISEIPFTRLFPEHPERGEKLVVWANRD
jgi:SAM-dependent methyltransferase